MEYLLFKWLHVLFSTVLFGTGIGSAFYLLVATLSRDLHLVAGVTRWVVRADWLFTATTAVLQPLSGLWMLHLAQIPLSTPWVCWSLVLYAVAIGCWLPVVWLQMRLRDLAAKALRQNTALPKAYWRFFAVWIALGVPALLLFLA
ncbi:MAG: integral rane protein, partial [Polaromonas sp.]|nr:integral rane protein [Polaromonas sp.]